MSLNERVVNIFIFEMVKRNSRVILNGFQYFYLILLIYTQPVDGSKNTLTLFPAEEYDLHTHTHTHTKRSLSMTLYCIYQGGEMTRSHGVCILLIISLSIQCNRECRRGVVAKVLACNPKVSEFELQSSYDIHFRTNKLEKVIKHFT